MPNEKEKCFVIMPISDPEGYRKGHFRCVYEDIFIPAIEEAGFKAKRADDENASTMIQVNIIRDIIEAPMAICDLSSRNPNVLFELGIRQAFDLPVVLVQEEDTPRIFDISSINTIDYRKSLIYREVLEDREKIKTAILSTKDNKSGINSIIKLLEIGNAQLKDGREISADDETKFLLNLVLTRLNNLEDDIKCVNKRASERENTTRLSSRTEPGYKKIDNSRVESSLENRKLRTELPGRLSKEFTRNLSQMDVIAINDEKM